MRKIDKGHKYELKNLHEPHQILTFIKKTPVAGSDKLEVVYDGTTNEEVLKALIDRMEYLNSVLSSREDQHVITLLKKALMWLEKRNHDRKTRKVRGTNKA